MADFYKRDYPAYIVILLISIFYWLGITSVPFHPDESTQLYMAADLKTLLTQPSDLIWHSGEEPDLRQYYREVDPPLTRYLIGLGLLITSQPGLDHDWDWGKSWLQNKAAGALPTDRQLLAARLGVAFLFPLSLLFAYWIGKHIRWRLYGWVNLALTASNALVLIHTRRAMAESALLFGVLFSIWAVISWKRQRFWLAIPVAIAFNAKYLALPLALIGLIAVLWDFQSEKNALSKKLLHSFLYCAIILVVTFGLNPFLWRSPVSALQDALTRRQELVSQQSLVFGQFSSTLVLDTFGEKAIGLLSQLYFAPPAVADIGNYSAELLLPTQSYSMNPLHTFMRGWAGGSIVLFFTLVGFVLWILFLARMKPPNRMDLLILIALVLQIAAIFAFILFPFQRYYIPLVPFSTLLLTFGLLLPIEFFKNKRSLDLSRDLRDLKE